MYLGDLGELNAEVEVTRVCDRYKKQQRRLSQPCGTPGRRTVRHPGGDLHTPSEVTFPSSSSNLSFPLYQPLFFFFFAPVGPPSTWGRGGVPSTVLYMCDKESVSIASPVK